MSSSNIGESPEDFWWSHNSQITKASNSDSVPVCNVAENKHTVTESVNGGDEMPIKTEETTEDITNVKEKHFENNNSVGKRPSGAQRRKRKWRRLESHTSSLEVNNIESGFKILNINDLGEDKVIVPSLSKNGFLNDNFKERNDSEKKFLSNKSTTHSEQRSLKSNKSWDKRFKPLSENETSQQCVNKRNYGDNSENGNVDCNENKNEAYSSVLKNKFHAVIIDESNVEGTLSPEQSDQIIDKLMTRLSQFTYSSDSEVPRFQGYYLTKGVLTINCVNDKSMEWLMNVQLNDLWDGAKIKIMAANEFSKVIRMTAFIPGPIRENFEILKLLKTQNSELKTSRWKIYHRSQGTSAGMTLVLGVDEKSLEVLRSLEMKPYYGMSRAAFYLPDTKHGSSSRK